MLVCLFCVSSFFSYFDACWLVNACVVKMILLSRFTYLTRYKTRINDWLTLKLILVSMSFFLVSLQLTFIIAYLKSFQKGFFPYLYMIFPVLATMTYINNFFQISSNTLLFRLYREKIQKIEQIQNKDQNLKTKDNNVVLNKVNIRISNKVEVTKKLDNRNKFVV